jgi:hypothetical protein
MNQRVRRQRRSGSSDLRQLRHHAAFPRASASNNSSAATPGLARTIGDNKSAPGQEFVDPSDFGPIIGRSFDSFCR